MKKEGRKIDVRKGGKKAGRQKEEEMMEEKMYPIDISGHDTLH